MELKEGRFVVRRIAMREEVKNIRQRHVLVVDDNAELAQTYQDLLEVFDYRVTKAADGERALKFILENEVDAILCDLSMPQLDGNEFYEAALQARPETAGRFIFVTGHVNHPKYGPFIKKSGVRALYKPVSMDKLLAELNAVVAGPPGP